jgi:hypothetical protein
VAAQQAQNDPQTAAAVMPFEVEQIAMRLRVPRATAAMMLLAQMQGEPMPAMAQGGNPEPGSPVLVGEHGPEVFVRNVPGTIVPGPLARYGGLSGDFTSRPPSLGHQLGIESVPLPGRGGPWSWERDDPVVPDPHSYEEDELWKLKAGETHAQRPSYLPPPEYDVPYTGNLTLSTSDDVASICFRSTVGCAYRTHYSSCHITMATDEVITSRRLDPLEVFRHEQGHCNGWPFDHRGTWLYRRSATH